MHLQAFTIKCYSDCNLASVACKTMLEKILQMKVAMISIHFIHACANESVNEEGDTFFQLWIF